MIEHRSTNRPSGTPESQSLRPSRLGSVLFAFYLALYAGFVFGNAFAPASMEQTPFAGVNLAVLSGLGLIAAAIILALIYDWFGEREGGR